MIVTCVILVVLATMSDLAAESQLLILCSSIVVIVTTVVVSETRVYNQGPLSPGTLIFISFVAYTAVPLLAVYGVGSGYSEAVFTHVATLHLAAVVGLYIGFRMGRNGGFRGSGVSPLLLRARISRPIALGIGIALALVGFGLLAVELSAAGGLSGLTEVSYGQRRALLKEPVIPLDISVHILNVALIIIAWVATGLSRRRWWLLLAVSLAVYGWIMFALGRRLPWGIAVLAILIIYDKRVSRIRWGKACAVGLVMVLVFGVWGRVRNLSNGTDIREYVASDFSLAWFSPAYAEVDGSVIVTLEAVRRFPDESNFLLGRSYARDMSLLIPRALYPGERPQPFRERFHAEYFPEMHARGAGFGSSPIAEAYMNFGLAGPVLIFGLIGAAVGGLTQFLERGSWHDGLLLTSSGAVPWFVLVMRSTTITIPKMYILLYLIPIVTMSVVADPRYGFIGNKE